MDILLTLVGIVVAIAAIAIAGFIIVILSMLLWASWPVVVGVVFGIWTWKQGNDNIGMLIILAGFLGQAVWMRILSGKNTGGGYYDPMAGKTRIYDKDGNISGYVDKD